MSGFKEFLAGEELYVLPPPGGSIKDGAAMTDCQADAYLSSVACIIKNRGMSRNEAVDMLWMKIDQVKNQEHFGLADDIKIIERLGAWALELAH